MGGQGVCWWVWGALGDVLFLFNETGMLQTCKTFLFHPAPQLLPLYLFILPPYQMILTMTSHTEHGK